MFMLSQSVIDGFVEVEEVGGVEDKGVVFCPFDDSPCFRVERCFMKVFDICLGLYVCVRVSLKGLNSVGDRGMGLTVYLKSVNAGRVPDEFCV